MAKIPGYLLVRLSTNGTAQAQFMLKDTCGNSTPIEWGDIGIAEQNFRETFGLTHETAAARVSDLEREKEVHIACDVDEHLLPRLCIVQGAGV